MSNRIPETTVSITLAASEFSSTTSGGSTKVKAGTSNVDEPLISRYGKNGLAFVVPCGIDITSFLPVAAIGAADNWISPSSLTATFESSL